ncbi:hypothetical protein [Saccharothrix australiensis]|uniref:Uncharacterized protein n=1 Tax=Saccharothrix australiensis TaxID=2072 RepID=A0A495WBK8_9PSEU|nr:hypothetical protein [Saccharothrix australiensis]RKT57188.1 hypothetical protein C8E97_5906 [Saccharothrix australiensis]
MSGAIAFVFGLCALSFAAGCVLTAYMLRREPEPEPTPPPVWRAEPKLDLRLPREEYATRPIHRNPVVGLPITAPPEEPTRPALTLVPSLDPVGRFVPEAVLPAAPEPAAPEPAVPEPAAAGAAAPHSDSPELDDVGLVPRSDVDHPDADRADAGHPDADLVDVDHPDVERLNGTRPDADGPDVACPVVDGADVDHADGRPVEPAEVRGPVDGAVLRNARDTTRRGPG